MGHTTPPRIGADRRLSPGRATLPAVLAAPILPVQSCLDSSSTPFSPAPQAGPLIRGEDHEHHRHAAGQAPAGHPCHRRVDGRRVRVAGKGGHGCKGGSHDLRRHRARRVRGFAEHRQGARRGGRRADRQAVGSDAGRCPRGLEGGAHPLSADGGLPLRQRHRRRLGGPGERLAARRGADRLCRRRLRHRVRREHALRRQRHRQPAIEIDGAEGGRHDDHAGAPVRHAAGGRRHRGQRRDRLSRDRVPALGPGPQRHRAGAGNRPATDFDVANCTGGNCDRRAAYLAAASDLLVADLAGDGRPTGRTGRRRRARRCSKATPRPASRPSSPAWARCPMASSPASA